MNHYKLHDVDANLDIYLGTTKKIDVPFKNIPITHNSTHSVVEQVRMYIEYKYPRITQILKVTVMPRNEEEVDTISAYDNLAFWRSLE